MKPARSRLQAQKDMHVILRSVHNQRLVFHASDNPSDILNHFCAQISRETVRSESTRQEQAILTSEARRQGNVSASDFRVRQVPLRSLCTFLG